MSWAIRQVDPNDLRLPPSRASGADAWKLMDLQDSNKGRLP
jgi:hypothetical protein